MGGPKRKEPPSRTRRLKEVHKQPPQFKNKFPFKSVKIGWQRSKLFFLKRRWPMGNGPPWIEESVKG
jgi:hypothetical protein